MPEPDVPSETEAEESIEDCDVDVAPEEAGGEGSPDVPDVAEDEVDVGVVLSSSSPQATKNATSEKSNTTERSRQVNRFIALIVPFVFDATII